MTERKEALEALLAKVKAGTLPAPRDFRAVFEVPMQDMEYTVRPDLARRAYGGSLDAALALHEAVLPGWDFAAGREGTLNGAIVVCPPTDEKFEHESHDAPPARALLTAILKALIAEASQ